MEAELLSALLVLGCGGLITGAMALLKKGSTKVEELPKRAKQAIVLVVAYGVVKLNGLLGLTLPVDALNWSADVVNTLITAGMSYGSYNIFKIRKPA